MKFHKLLFIIIVFFKTETLFSKNDLFIVNNIQIEKNDKITNTALSELAIKKGFNQLISKILLDQDMYKLSNLNFSTIKQLVRYYQITNIPEKQNDKLLNFNISFDKNRIHDLFYKKEILYSEITDKELYILPILIKGNDILIFSNNYFYENWNKIKNYDLIEFILPIEKIEIIKNINDNKSNLISLNISEIFEEYGNKNLALILIEDNNNSSEKIYIKTILQNNKPP